MTRVDTESETMNDPGLKTEPVIQAVEEDAKKGRPTKTSCCGGIKAFLVALSFTYFSKVFSGAIMKSSITQMERRFGMSSSAVGFIDGGFEMGNLLVIAFVSYFGAKFHRPRIIALGCLLMSLGSMLATVPHFIMGYYKYETISLSSDSETPNISPCSVNQTVVESEGGLGSGCAREVTSYAWLFVWFGNVLRGIGETPITPLGISYIDDFSKEEDAPFYIGCLHTVAMVGPMAGYLLGSLLAKLYVDIGFVDLGLIRITPMDSRWVGAWWLGFLVGAIFNLISGIPFFFLPKSLNKEGEDPPLQKTPGTVRTNGSESQAQKSEKKQVGTRRTGTFKDFFHSLKRMFSNPMYVVFLCCSLLQFSSFIGYLTYHPKYIEQQYKRSASSANFVTAVAVLPAVSLGMFLGGLIMKKYKLGIIPATKLAFGLQFISFLIQFSYLAVGCENRTVAGLTVSYEGQPIPRDTLSLSSPCNFNCSCPRHQWDPVCGANGITYVSACFAGCKDVTGTKKDIIFQTCSCVEKVASTSNSTAVLGECPRSEQCTRNFYYFMTIKVISSFFYALAATPSFMIMIRCVHPDLKSLAVGIYMLVMRALAGIPAAVYFGALIDQTCLMWSRSSCGRQGACRLYDSAAYRQSYFGLIFGLRAPSYLLGLAFFLLVKKHFGGKGTKPSENGMKESVPLNEEAKANGSELPDCPSGAAKDTTI